jgi:hypothetical protein
MTVGWRCVSSPHHWWRGCGPVQMTAPFERTLPGSAMPELAPVIKGNVAGEACRSTGSSSVPLLLGR